MVTIDRLAVRADGTIHCPLRGKAVGLAECERCGYLQRVEPVRPPHFIVCNGPYVLGWLGLDSDT